MHKRQITIVSIIAALITGAVILYALNFSLVNNNHRYCALCGHNVRETMLFNTFIIKSVTSHNDKMTDWHDSSVNHILLTGGSTLTYWNGTTHEDSQYSGWYIHELIDKIEGDTKIPLQKRAVKLFNEMHSGSYKPKDLYDLSDEIKSLINKNTSNQPLHGSRPR